MTDTPFKSGFVALVGRPNAGKSTLLNAACGQRIAITSPVAQTTRKRLRAVVNTPTSQIVIVDTPGLHKPKDALGSELNKAALAELADADVVAFLVDATKPVGTGDAWVASHVAKADADYKLLVVTKADIAGPQKVAEQLEAARGGFVAGQAATTVLWLGVAAALLVIGSRRDGGPMIPAALALAAFCLGKLVLFDLSFLDGLPRVASFILGGLLLLAMGVAFAQLQERGQRRPPESGPVENSAAAATIPPTF